MKDLWGDIHIWLTPDKEECLSVPQLAGRIGISCSTLYRRLHLYGPDHCLTYWYGELPGIQRAYASTSVSTIRSIKRGSLLKSSEVDHRSARMLILKLIKRSQDDFLKTGCQSSRDFLLNKDGMLEWYLELMFSEETCTAYIERLRRWTFSNNHKGYEALENRILEAI